jgi:hypothetical protein
MYGVGILAAGVSDVKIVGPGVIQKFQRWGILLALGDHITVKEVTVNRNCWSGMQTFDISDSRFEK